MNIAQFLARLIWIGIFCASIGVAVDVTKALRDLAVEAHKTGPISASRFTHMMTDK